MRQTFSALVAVLLLSACSGDSEQEVAANAMDVAPDSDEAVAPPPTANSQTPAGAPVEDRGNGNDDKADANIAIVPARFHGEWNSDRAACGTGASETRLRIDGDRLRFYESVGAVRRVEVESARVIEVTAEYQGEGQTWQGERRLSLSPDGDSLTVTGDGGSLVRYRCG